MIPDQNYLEHLRDLLKEQYTPVQIDQLPKGLTFYSTEQLIAKFESFMPEGVLTRESIYSTLQKMGFELAEIKPFSYVWVMQTKRV